MFAVDEREALSHSRFGSARWAGVAVLLSLAACGAPQEPSAPEIRPVRATVVEELATGEKVVLTGRVESREEVNLAFRVGQRMSERRVDVGDRVEAGQLVARLESTTVENALAAARANLAAAEARAVDARQEFQRQETLLARGVSPRATFERATAAREAAQAAVAAARAQLDTVREQLTYTELFADAAGTVTAVGAEPGEVVGAGQMVVRLAREGGRDAVFGVPGRIKDAASGLDPEVTVTLVSDPGVRAEGRVREVSPQADPTTGTFAVRVGLIDPPAAMRLGSTVTGSIRLGYGAAIRVPASALTSEQGQPAVWLYDPATSTVSLRRVEVASFAVADVEIAGGLVADDIVVTAGVQSLRPGQKVRLLETVQ